MGTMNQKSLLILAAISSLSAVGFVSATRADTPVPGASLWLEADQGLAADGSTWMDQSGNGNNATALPGGAPTVVPGVFNGLPAVQFTGGQAMSFANQIITSQQFTIVALVTDATTPSSANLGFREIFSSWDPTNETTSVFLGTTSVNPVAVRFTDDIGGATDPNGHVQTGVGAVPNPSSLFVLSGVSASTDAQVYLNSGLFYDQGVALTGRDLTTGYYLGEQGSSPFEFWNGDIEELLVYNTALTPLQIAQDDTYLMQKYGFTGVPEPATWAMLLVGFAGLGAAGYRTSRKRPAVEA
jgi:hypothetical protein